MTPDTLATIHRLAFQAERPWSVDEFSELLANPHVGLHSHRHGFALSRSIAGESELLTLAVDPDYQRRGIGRALTRQWLSDVANIAQTAFLEVAADNTAACHVYRTECFTEIARRPAYYARKNGAAMDAILMRRDLTCGQLSESGTQPTESG